MRPSILYILYTTSLHEQNGLEETNVSQKNINQFCIKLMSHLQTIIMMTYL